MDNVKRLPLRDFTRFCMSIAQVPSSYVSGLTMEEQLLWLCSYLTNEVIPTVNNNGQAVEELQTLYVQLKNYVDNYFDNLDIQEEVNTKLEEMAQSGELAELISQYLEAQAIIGFNTNSSLAAAENLANGSFARTYGKETYNDGKGAFYKIRTRTNADVPDGDTLITLTNTENLVAEIIPYSRTYDLHEEIENVSKKTDMFNLNMQPNIIYDLTESSYTQGSCVIGSTLYVYAESNFPNGDIYKFNISNGSFIEKVSNKKLYHGNDMCAIGSNIYVASCKDELGNNSNKKIVIFDTLTNNVTEINPFSETSDNFLFGIEKYDDNTLLCALGSTDETIANMSLVLYNISSQEITPLTITNTNDVPENIYHAHQAISYLDNKIYMMTSMNDCIIEFDLDNNVANLNKIYNLPIKDNNGQLVGEYEGLSICKIFGENALMITSSIIDNASQNYRTIKAYVVDPINNNSFNNFLIYPALSYVSNNDQRIGVKLKKSSTSLFENGSTYYPFKTLTRAINGIKYKNDVTDIGITIMDSESYYADTICNIRLGIGNAGYSVSPTIHIKRILDCDLAVTGANNTDAIMNVYLESNLDGSNNRYDIGNSIVNFRNVNLYVVNRTWISQTKISYFGTNIKKASTYSTSNPPFFYANHCIIQDSLAGYSSEFGSLSKWIRLVGDSVIYATGSDIVSNYASKIDGTANTITILPGTYHN